jgi:AAA15 family ATPase/GTPase
MVVSFSVSNFRSFWAEETLSLVASNRLMGTHDGHTVPIPASEERVLRTAVLYGANGAGKSNLYKAFRYLKSVALKPRKRNVGTSRDAFRFSDRQDEPSTFDLQFIAASKLYRFGFKVDDQKIIEEWLVQVDGAREKTLYERTTDAHGTVKIEAPGLKSEGEKLRALVTVGGPQNQSFLATMHATLDGQELGDEMNGILKWFRRRLVLIGPTTNYNSLGVKLARDKDFSAFAGEFLKSSSTGVDHLDVREDEIGEDELRTLLPESMVSKILKDVSEDEDGIARVKLADANELLLERTDQNHYYRISIQAAHDHGDGKTTPLELKEESDGTQRLLNLLPALHSLKLGSAIFFVDEIDRSLHPILAFKFLEFFLNSCEGGQRQVIVTTHESNLLDLDLLRRDEIWFAEKDERGATHLYSLADFKVRKDLEIRKHYLQGRFGAIPYLGNLDRLMHKSGSPE